MLTDPRRSRTTGRGSSSSPGPRAPTSARRDDSTHKQGFDLREARREGHTGSADDAEARQRQLPRLRRPDDGGGALARPRGALRLGLSATCRPRRTAHTRRRLDARLGQVYVPGAGWMEFDPTNGIVGNRDLIRVAVARDPSQAVPISGTYDRLSVRRLCGMTVEVESRISRAAKARGQDAVRLCIAISELNTGDAHADQAGYEIAYECRSPRRCCSC